MRNKYGKPSGPLLNHKSSFFEENDALKATALDHAKLYTCQPQRERCKICEHILESVSFHKQNIPFIICENCGHLNGHHEDTDEFCNSIYIDDDGISYGENYSASDRSAYIKRRDDIYGPKADFMIDSLIEVGETPQNLRYADFGAGAGYFLSALRDKNISSISGYEASKYQVNLGNYIIGKDSIKNHKMSEIYSIAESIKVDVVSMIGVLEHIQKPRQFIQALNKNTNVRYFFISVPLFSPCVYFEMAFPDIMHRQLTGGHTHLFTKNSLDYLVKEYGLVEKTAWWFGADIVDLFRSILIRIQKQPETKNMADKWQDLMQPVLDDLQLVLDEKHLSSEVHVLYQIIR